MREHNKRWLLSILKTSGSQRRYVINGCYADDRNKKINEAFENLPQRESIKSTRKFYNGKLDFGPLVRFLRSQVGNNWDNIYAEIISRIPSKLLDYREMIYWFVADQVEMINGKPWNKRTQKFIRIDDSYDPVHYTDIKTRPELREFYVDPSTNKLVRIQQKSTKLSKKKGE